MQAGSRGRPEREREPTCDGSDDARTTAFRPASRRRLGRKSTRPSIISAMASAGSFSRCCEEGGSGGGGIGETPAEGRAGVWARGQARRGQGTYSFSTCQER
jgi:hypothetical protein